MYIYIYTYIYIHIYIYIDMYIYIYIDMMFPYVKPNVGWSSLAPPPPPPGSKGRPCTAAAPGAISPSYGRRCRGRRR